MAAPSLDMSCADISAIKESLRVMRKIDDNIVHALNTAIPTASFAEKEIVTDQCKDLYNQLMDSHRSRQKVIKSCIDETAKEVQLLKEKKNNDPDNLEVLKDLRKVQSKFRLMQNELNIEEVIKDRSTKYFASWHWKHVVCTNMDTLCSRAKGNFLHELYFMKDVDFIINRMA